MQMTEWRQHYLEADINEEVRLYVYSGVLLSIWNLQNSPARGQVVVPYWSGSL